MGESAGRPGVITPPQPQSNPFDPLFRADWERVTFFHFNLDPQSLQRLVPFPLHLWEGRAFVSLVAFSLGHMRFHRGGAFGALLCRPVATQRFLNVRTYVVHRGEPGIFFMREWLSNRLCVRLGPQIYGLPYRFAHIDYTRAPQRPGKTPDGEMAPDFEPLHGTVFDPGEERLFEYNARLPCDAEFRPCRDHSLAEFLLERYTAFTTCNRRRRFFRVWHQPWQQSPIGEVSFSQLGLVTGFFPALTEATFAGAHYSPGVRDVCMGCPHEVSEELPSSRQMHALVAVAQVFNSRPR